MKGNRAAIRYAKSLLSLAIEQKKEDKVRDDMAFVAETVENSRDLNLLLKSPIVKGDQKQQVLDKLFTGKVTDLSEGFLKIMTSKKREDILGMIATEYLTQYKLEKNISSAEVISAVPLSKEVLAKVEKIIKDSEKQDIELKQTVNPDIIGGLIVRVGDKQIDASISRKISDLKQRFSTNPYVADY